MSLVLACAAGTLSLASLLLARHGYSCASYFQHAAEHEMYDPKRHREGDYVCATGKIMAYDSWPTLFRGEVRSAVAESKTTADLRVMYRCSPNLFIGNLEEPTQFPTPMIRLATNAELPLAWNSFRSSRVLLAGSQVTAFGRLSVRDHASIALYERLLSACEKKPLGYDPETIMCVKVMQSDLLPMPFSSDIIAFGPPERTIQNTRLLADVCLGVGSISAALSAAGIIRWARGN